MAGRRANEREVRSAIRAAAKSSAATARVSRREAERQAKEALYAARFYRRDVAARIRQTAREAELRARAAASERRLLAHYLTPTKRRTSYQRRVVGSVARQVERGERPVMPRRVRPAGAAQASLRWYRQYLETENGGAVRRYFEELPIDQQREYLDAVIEANAEWRSAGQPNTRGNPLRLFLMYHW